MDLRYAVLQQFKHAMEVAIPSRVVTRSLKDFADRSRQELQSGIFTIQVSGQSTPLGDTEHLNIAVVGQFSKPEKTDPSLVEDEELKMIHELEQFINNVDGINVQITKWHSSQQLDAPYGWVRAEMILGPFLFYLRPDDDSSANLADFITFKPQVDIEPFASQASHEQWLQEPPDYSQSAPDLIDQQQVRDPL